jgi:hypothetical protein
LSIVDGQRGGEPKIKIDRERERERERRLGRERKAA